MGIARVLALQLWLERDPLVVGVLNPPESTGLEVGALLVLSLGIFSSSGCARIEQPLYQDSGLRRCILESRRLNLGRVLDRSSSSFGRTRRFESSRRSGFRMKTRWIFLKRGRSFHSTPLVRRSAARTRRFRLGGEGEGMAETF